MTRRMRGAPLRPSSGGRNLSETFRFGRCPPWASPGRHRRVALSLVWSGLTDDPRAEDPTEFWGESGQGGSLDQWTGDDRWATSSPNPAAYPVGGRGRRSPAPTWRFVLHVARALNQGSATSASPERPLP